MFHNRLRLIVGRDGLVEIQIHQKVLLQLIKKYFTVLKIKLSHNINLKIKFHHISLIK